MERVAASLQRLRSLDLRLLDGALALGLTVWAIAELPSLSEHTSKPALLVMTAAIAFRRRWPLGVLVVAFGCLLAENDGDGRIPELAALLVAVYSAALYSRHRLIVFTVVALAASFAAAIGGGLPVTNQALLPFLIAGPVWLAGSALRRRERRADAWADRASRLEREQDIALAKERSRIARELHDVVTHGVSVMVLQTGAARQILSKDPSGAGELLRSVESGGRSALDELRRLLGLLSSDDTAPLTPAPGVAQVPPLVERVREAGLPVELAVEGDAQPLPAGIDLAAYRIVQEALTNALKHSRLAPTRVILRYGEGALELEVIDQGPPVSADINRNGRGLVGMRERVAIYGGTVEAKPETTRGYAVRVRLPFTPVAG
jgi:signal transduction histidine kinase